MQTLSEIRAILAERDLRPRHRLGQNFLHDGNLIRKLVAAADLQPGEVVLEIGPGTGAVTEALVETGAQLIACEIDDDLAQIIEDRLGDRITLVRGDCLQKHRTLAPRITRALASRPFKLVANLPYQVASPLMTALLLDDAGCTGQFVTIQEEVAERLLASPGGKTYGPLGIIIQALAEVSRIATVAPTCFWPQPKVQSAMVSIVPRTISSPGGESRLATPEQRQRFARFITGLFSKRRKQLGTVFGRERTWPEGVTAEMRAEALSVSQLIDLWRTSPM